MATKIKISNKGRKFGASKHYIFCEIDNESYLFTEHQLIVAKLRAQRNPEDMPKKSFWQKLFC